MPSGSAFPLYVHIPFCVKKCDYCDFFSRAIQISDNNVNNFTIKDKANALIDTYIEALKNQINAFVGKFNIKEWNSLYIGGGTPSIMSSRQILRLCEIIHSAAPLSPGAEATIEANPRFITESFLNACRTGGINRLSVGIQCMNDKVLRAAGRLSDRAEIISALEAIKEFWPHSHSSSYSWNADLIAGLPFQTKEDLEHDAALITEAGAAHVSLYQLTVEEGTPLEARIASGSVQYDEDKAAELWLFARDLLEKKGLIQYEVSNFARPGFESRHNTAYWEQRSYIGCGAGASGSIYAAPEGIRWTSTRDIEKYTAFWLGNPRGQDPLSLCGTETLDIKTQGLEFLMLGFRTMRGISAEEYERRFGGRLKERIGAFNGGLFDEWQKKGHARTHNEGGRLHYALTREGILFLNRFLEELL